MHYDQSWTLDIEYRCDLAWIEPSVSRRAGGSCCALVLEGFTFETFVFVFGVSQEVTLPTC